LRPDQRERCQSRRSGHTFGEKGGEQAHTISISKCLAHARGERQQRCADRWSAKHAHAVAIVRRKLFGTPSNLQGMRERDRNTGASGALNMQRS